jgi:hypothetical protein
MNRKGWKRPAHKCRGAGAALTMEPRTRPARGSLREETAGVGAGRLRCQPAEGGASSVRARASGASVSLTGPGSAPPRAASQPPARRAARPHPRRAPAARAARPTPCVITPPQPTQRLLGSVAERRRNTHPDERHRERPACQRQREARRRGRGAGPPAVHGHLLRQPPATSIQGGQRPAEPQHGHHRDADEQTDHPPLRHAGDNAFLHQPDRQQRADDVRGARERAAPATVAPHQPGRAEKNGHGTHGAEWMFGSAGSCTPSE